MAGDTASQATYSATAKLREKRKSIDADEASLATVDKKPRTAIDAAATRRNLPVRAKDGDRAGSRRLVVEQRESVHENDSNVDDDDDDDDAPEALSTAQAVAATRYSAHRATKAAEIRAAELKRKRQDHDTLLKAQRAARQARDADKEEPEAADAAMDDTMAEMKAETRQRPTPSKRLPLAFLASDDEEEDDNDEEGKNTHTIRPSVAVTARRRHPTKTSRDRMLGATVFRVLGTGGPSSLPPKVHKYTRGVREALLARKRRVGRAVLGGSRSGSGGFLVQRR